jgi:hypothetical protein
VPTQTKPVALTGNSTQDSDALAGAILERLSVLARAAALETLETVDAGGARPSLSVHDLAQELSSRPAPPQAPAGAAAAQAARQRISDAIAPLLKRQTPAGARALARALVPSAIDADLSEAAPVLVLSPKLSGMLAGSGVEAAMKAALEELSYNDVLSADLGDDASVGSGNISDDAKKQGTPATPEAGGSTQWRGPTRQQDAAGDKAAAPPAEAGSHAPAPARGPERAGAAPADVAAVPTRGIEGVASS